MKKLLLAITFFITLITSAQTFTRQYDLVVVKNKGTRTLNEAESTNILVVFSGNDKGDIIILNTTAKGLVAERYYKTGRILEGTSKDGFQYKYIETVNEKQEKVIMQLFDIGVFRVHNSQVTYEYQQTGN